MELPHLLSNFKKARANTDIKSRRRRQNIRFVTS